MDVAVIIMVKDEASNILRTLVSVQDYIKQFVILDTGSTDDTIQIIREWCDTHEKDLLLRESPFRNFADSRNELLELAESVPHAWLLLMDAGDEARGDWTTLQNSFEDDIDGLSIQQRWNLQHIYRNMRCVRNRANWRFKGVVHEYITREKTYHFKDTRTKQCPAEFYLFQDRVACGGSSANRFQKDYVVLKHAIEEEPDNERYMFYMAQTCRCVNKYTEACVFYNQYATIGTTFVEEQFVAKLNDGKSLVEQGLVEIALERFHDAYNLLARAEPLVEIAQLLIRRKQWRVAYMYLKRACALPFPTSAILFVDPHCYETKRGELLKHVESYVHKRGNLDPAQSPLSS